jgi:acetyl-CoA/propionyl-CoA carboxylase, biotin carboxylase, biotin carboxyl carrier protein
MRKLLVANRGEIAVRVIRACRDAELATVAVYADGDREAPHAQMADEAYSLDGEVALTSYLAVEKLLQAARVSGADAIHPGYGFLAENAEFAQAVIDEGLTWIGPAPGALRALGDKLRTRDLARAAGAALLPAASSTSAEEVGKFARDHGLPVAIKAVHGGGGHGIRVARHIAEIPDLYQAAARESHSAFGREACFAETYVDMPRHVEAQCLADNQGHVVVVSTRDCSVQRRSQKLLEEAPAPFLTVAQETELRRVSKALLLAVAYVGAATCEFLLSPDGALWFLEVNPRLQVEHPVTEEVTGVDIVREMLRLAAGEPLDYDDPVVVGHAFEFRVNAEDPGRAFLPSPGVITEWDPPSGPGVRLDSGVVQGSLVDKAFDSLVAKLIVRGRDRLQALQRARRALDEFVVEGVATTLPFHRVAVRDPTFAPGPGEPISVHTQWVDREFAGRLQPYTARVEEAASSRRQRVVVEVNGKRLEVTLPISDGHQGGLLHGSASPPAASQRPVDQLANVTGAAVRTPTAGLVVQILVTEGQEVQEGDVLAIVEFMKMEHPLLAHRDGVVKRLPIRVGASVPRGAVICEIDS